MLSDDYDETFMCVICFESPKDRLMCRFCSKFICASCLNKIFGPFGYDQKCPHCRAVVSQEDFTKVLWLPDHLKEIDDQVKTGTANKCSEHERQELSIFCQTCGLRICAHCVLPMFHGKHVQHDYCSSEDIYAKTIKEVREHINHSRHAVHKGQKEIEKNKKSSNTILQYRKQRRDEFNKMHASIHMKIDRETDKYLEKIEGERTILNDQINQHNEVITMAEQEINSKTETELISMRKELLSRFQKLPSISTFNSIDTTKNILSDFLTLPWQTGEFILYGFSRKNSSWDNFIVQKYSLDYNQSWSFMVHPNYSTDKHRNVLSVFLKLNNGMLQPIDYTYIVELVHSSGDVSLNYTMKGTGQFKSGWQNGWKSFYPIEHLNSGGFLWPDEDKIKFIFKFQPATIFEQNKVLEWHLNQMEHKARNAEDAIARLQEEKKKIEQTVTEQRRQIEKIEKREIQLKETLGSQQKDRELITDQRSELKALKRDNESLKKKLNDFVAAQKRHCQEDLRNELQRYKKTRNC
ncbi:unnamed protein product [Rotaria sordida]|uniref:B box-type domain-containing protein n=1 Tax=Rotaria sordida TaxID=392033 RepID=A0A814X5X1_9BILA|nr:unnamed protein product [Rotaria sordida]CAF1488863.1 unnamed protein product [Rotaria sordida]